MNVTLTQPNALTVPSVRSSHINLHPSLSLSSVEDLLKSPIRPSDIFTSIPGIRRPGVLLLFMNLFHRAASCTGPGDTRKPFLRLHMFPTVVLRRAFRGTWLAQQIPSIKGSFLPNPPFGLCATVAISMA